MIEGCRDDAPDNTTPYSRDVMRQPQKPQANIRSEEKLTLASVKTYYTDMMGDIEGTCKLATGVCSYEGAIQGFYCSLG